MAHSWMKAGGERREEAASGDTGLACCLLRERVWWEMGAGVSEVGLSEDCTLGDRRGTAVGRGGAMGDAVGACDGVTLGEGLGAVVAVTLVEGVGAGGNGIHWLGVGRAGELVTSWAGKMGMCSN